MSSAKLLVYNRAMHRRARAYKEELLSQMFGSKARKRKPPVGRWHSLAAWNIAGSNILGIDFGTKEVGGALRIDAGPTLRVYVSKKMGKAALSKRGHKPIPREINGLQTDVIPIGDFVAAARPAQGGVPGGNWQVQPGTLGSLVVSRGTANSQYLLSCFHVLANLAAPVIRDRVLEPPSGPPIAELWTWINLFPAGNLVDCAIAKLLTPGDFLPNLRQFGRQSTTPMAAQQNQQVKKSGSMAPPITYGTVCGLSADAHVTYPQGRYGFVKQIAVRSANGAFAATGDSGSLVVDSMSLNPIGLIFAVDMTSGIALANPIANVLNMLRVDLA
jgi:hypothetical protein